MRFLFGVIGAILGALMGEWLGAVIGLGAGIALATLLKKADAPAPGGAPKGQPASSPPAAITLEARVATLEREVAALRAEVTRLTPVHGSPDAQHAVALATIAGAAASEISVPTTAAVPGNDDADDNAFEFTLDAPEVATVQASTAAPPPAIAEIAAISESAATSESAAISESTQSVASTPPTAPAPRPAPASPPPSLKDRLPPVVSKLIFGGNTIVKVGVLILFLGLAFLLRYAAERVTVPVELRYAGVALIGIVLLGLGWRLRRRPDGYGLILQGAGIGVFYLTTLAALKLSQLLPPEMAFAFLFVVAVLSAVLAVVQDAPWLAYVAAAEGFAAPVLVSTGGGNHIALFSYLAILDIGIFLMAWFKAWRPLNLTGAVGTFALAGAWAQKYYTDALYPSTQAFLLFFFVLFTVVGVLFARRALALGEQPDERSPLSARAAQVLAQVGRVDSTLAFGVPLAAYGLQYLMVRDMEFGPAWAAVGFALFYLLLGGALLRGDKRYALLGEAYTIVAVIFGTLAIPLALEGEWTGATWAVEAAGMHWLGIRQHRRYARAFALLVLAAATFRSTTALGLDFTPGTPLFTGSVVGMILLAASALAMFNASRRGQLDREAAWEGAGLVGQLWIGLGALAAIGWLLLVPAWACVATSALALACSLAQRRIGLPALQWAGAALHALALGSFATTLHALHGEAMLGSGWQGLAAATLIGSSLLVSAWLPLRDALRKAETDDVAPTWSLGSSLGLLAGMAAVSTSLLFVMPADDAAPIWPWLGLAALWLGLRLGHPALAVAWCALQLVAALAFGFYGEPLWASESPGLTLWTPLIFTVASLLAGDALQAAGKKAGRLKWLQAPWVQWGIVAWSLAWWTQVLLPDTYRYLLHTQKDWALLWPHVLVAWLIASSIAITALAAWRDWRVLGLTAWGTVPAWALTALAGIGAMGYAPHAHLGWLVWPLALVWHALLLRAFTRWCSHKAMVPLHVMGFWFFLTLAAYDLQWWAASWGDPGSAWPLLGWVLVPAIVMAGLTRPVLLSRWPFNAFREAYLVIACVPVAVYLMLWLWSSNTQSGTPAPLPYVPLLNPLELGHALVLLALYLWRATLPESARVPRPVLLAGLGATAFALYTGVVLRTCHHWAGVPWEAEAMFASTLAQAALSVAWAIVGVGLMLVGHRRVERIVWVVGAALLGVVVLKLFFVELADRGGLYRIVSFIVVGVLLLAVGYFAPVPPQRKEQRDAA